MADEKKNPDELPRLCLANLGGKDINGRSGAEELFGELLGDVLDNIARLDTDAMAKREITLKILFVPNGDRNLAAVEVTGSTKLAPLASAHGRVALGIVLGEHVAAPIHETLPLFEEPKAPMPVALPKTGTDQAK
jgi:hypothetical protein